MTLVLSKKSSAQVPLSLEENDLLRRSAKKIKNGDGEGADWPHLGAAGSLHWQNGQSFADKLQGINNGEVKHGGDGVAMEMGEAGKKDVQSEEGDGGSSLDVWKVVQKHRRPKKVVKDRESDVVCYQEGGSRFKALMSMDDSNVGGAKGIPQPALPIVQSDAGDVKEYQKSRQTRSSKRSRLEKGGEKKKNSKKQGMSGGNGGKSRDRQDHRKEKRTRETEQDEAKSIEGKAGYYVISNGEGDEVAALQKGVHETNESNNQMESDIEEFNPTPQDPGVNSSAHGLVGKFWAGPDSGDPDSDMLSGDPEAEMLLGDNEKEVVGTTVPETQLDTLD
ncbi:hypothetical protein K1719_044864 [Acacia pycnantha]|nr:hypothetical protein K1719_044864 [Acacia pycnantha]